MTILSDEGLAVGASPSDRVLRASALSRWQQLASAGALGTVRSIDDGTMVFERDDPTKATFFLTSGAIEIVQRAATGYAIVVKILVGPALFGAIEPLSVEPRYLESVRVLGGARVASMTTERFLELCATDARAAFEALVDTSRAFSVAARFENARLSDTEALLANIVCAYAEVLGEPVADGLRIELRRTQADFADAIGATERSVNRILAQWKSEALVEKQGGRYLVRNGELLRERAGELIGSLVHRALPCG